MTDAFDADVLIFASKGDARGTKAESALRGAEASIGSLLLLAETLVKPGRTGDDAELDELARLLVHIDLKPVDEEIATAAVSLGVKYALRAADAVHLATAVVWGAERFHTNNRSDFGRVVDEIEIVFGGDTT